MSTVIPLRAPNNVIPFPIEERMDDHRPPPAEPATIYVVPSVSIERCMTLVQLVGADRLR